MARVVWSETAVAWLDDIYEYIARDNPTAAKRTVQAIYDKAMLLSKFPELGYRYERWPERQLRILLYGHYRIVYSIEEDETVSIVGVFHAALEMDRYLVGRHHGK
jgi:toxin ParE1/3/4